MERMCSQNWFWQEWIRAVQFSRFCCRKRGNLESCGGENCTRAPWTFPFKPVRTSSFGPVRVDKWKETLATNLISKGGWLALHLHATDYSIQEKFVNIYFEIARSCNFNIFQMIANKLFLLNINSNHRN